MMYRRQGLVIVALVLSLLVFSIAQSRGAAPEVLAKGKQLFERSCSACHGMNAKGLPRLGKDLTTSAFVKKLTDDELLAFVKRGRPAFDRANTTHVDMPPKGGNPALTDDHLRAIITYIRSLAE